MKEHKHELQIVKPKTVDLVCEWKNSLWSTCVPIKAGSGELVLTFKLIPGTGVANTVLLCLITQMIKCMQNDTIAWDVKQQRHCTGYVNTELLPHQWSEAKFLSNLRKPNTQQHYLSQEHTHKVGPARGIDPQESLQLWGSWESRPPAVVYSLCCLGQWRGSFHAWNSFQDTKPGSIDKRCHEKDYRNTYVNIGAHRKANQEI